MPDLRRMSNCALIAAAIVMTSVSFPAYAQLELHPALRLVNQMPTPDGLTESLGDLMFSADGSIAYFISGSESSSSEVLTAPVLRDPDGTVTGFGAFSEFFAEQYLDTGLEFAPGSATLFFRGEGNGVGQRAANGDIEYTALVDGDVTYGGLAFVPPGYTNTGSLVASAYETGVISLFDVTDDLDGTFTLGTETTLAVPGGVADETMGDAEFVTSGFFADHLLIAIYDDDEGQCLVSMELDSVTGLPVGPFSNVNVLARGLDGVWGAAIDPVTGNFWLIQYDGAVTDRLFQLADVGIFVDGFESGNTSTWSSTVNRAAL